MKVTIILTCLLIAVVPRLLGHAPAAIAARTEALLTRLHLPPARYAGQLPAQLSGGQQQRVGLARALAADPPIILMDEPFGALDPITRASIRRDFRELDELQRKTVVLVTHDVTEAFELADRILLLDAGRVQQLGTPRELLFRPANDFVRRFFAAERLALQLRTLTLGEVLPEYSSSLPVNVSSQPGEGLSQPGNTPSQPQSAPSQEGNASSRLEDASSRSLGASSRSLDASSRSLDASSRLLDASSQSLDASSRLGDASSRPLEALFMPATTVHDALDALTGADASAAPFTVAQLMAAFGEALQREEAAWKR